jgi:hypothetical protein
LSWNESEILEARRAIFAAAQDMLAGRLSYIEGARRVVAAKVASRLDQWDVDLLPFAGIDSDTETFPFGDMRAHWQAAALESLEPKIIETEAWARSVGEPHCRSLVKCFSSGEIEIENLIH